MPYYKKHEMKALDTLSASSHNTSQKIGRVSAKIAELLPRMGLRPSLFSKITQWIEHLAILQKKEQEILDQILTIEDIHKKQRNGKRLKKAKPVFLQPDTLSPDAAPVRKKAFWAVVLAVLLMEPSRKKSHPQLKND